jgi:hypothetical protein
MLLGEHFYPQVIEAVLHSKPLCDVCLLMIFGLSCITPDKTERDYHCSQPKGLPARKSISGEWANCGRRHGSTSPQKSEAKARRDNKLLLAIVVGLAPTVERLIEFLISFLHGGK